MHTRKECVFCLFVCFVFLDVVSYADINEVPNCSVASFKISVTLMIFFQEDLSVDVRVALKSPTTIVFLSISPFMSVSICFIYLGVPILSAYMLTSAIVFSYIDPFIIT